MSVSTPYVWVSEPAIGQLSKFSLTGNLVATFKTYYETKAAVVDVEGDTSFVNSDAGTAGFNWGHITYDSSIATFHSILGGPGDVRGIAADKDGYLWIAVKSFKSVHRYHPDGTRLGSFFIGNSPTAVAVDGNRQIWVSNPGSKEVSKFSITGLRLRTRDIGKNIGAFAPDISNDSMWATHYAANAISRNSQSGGKIFTVTVASPVSVATDLDENAWAIDHFGGRVIKIDKQTGVILLTVGVGTQPRGLAVDEDNNVWCLNTVADNIIKISTTGLILGTFSANAPQSRGDFTGFTIQQLPESETPEFVGTLYSYSTDAATADGLVQAIGVEQPLFDGQILLISDAAFLFDGKIILPEQTNDLFDGIIFVYSAQTSLFDGVALIISSNASLFNGVITLYSGHTSLFDGRMSLESGVQPRKFDGVVFVYADTTSVVDGTTAIVNSSSATFDSVLAIRALSETQFNGTIRISDFAYGDFNGAVRIIIPVDVTFSGRMAVMGPLTVSFDGLLVIWSNLRFVDGRLVVYETVVQKYFSGELFVTRGTLSPDGISLLEDTYVGEVTLGLQIGEIVVPPRD